MGTRVVAREGAVLLRTRVVAREGLFLWKRWWWHGRGCSCGNEGGGTGGVILVGTMVVAREGLLLWERGG